MDLSSLKQYSASLVDYIGTGNKKTGTGYFDSVAQNLLNTVSSGLAGSTTDETAASAGEKIELSAEAQALLAAGNKSASGENTATGVQKIGQNFMMSFFDQSGIDFESLSPDALDLLTGLQDVISGSGVTGRDLSTDTAEMKYNPGRKVYTLTGTSERLRIAIDYTDGAPSKLSVTDITGGKVETAEITIGTNSNGEASTIEISRTQKAYANGHMIDVGAIDPLSVPLYS
ncbi:MAG: hypothetical protein DI551_03915 [Micavibrio aeruginosavorus]|uniref:Uncharacterized protein n=1 Tax=Micavibrio aeruginosavorus TaxID=349221 RepID=A0A2W5PQX3_9BACT|nr:MAG: hypothetical protein DI551_03915 [Micavibrio aeruginosavorus]